MMTAGLVLIVEDDLALRQGLRSLLETDGFSVREVSSGEEAFSALRYDPIETVLLDINIVTQIPQSLPFMQIDVRALTEVIYTLLDNARKYSPEFSTITLSARKVGAGVEVSVADEGEGISDIDLERVFDKFYRGKGTNNNRTNNPGGLGIGLSIAKAIVEAHDGSIWVAKSAPSTGATIMFRIPMRES